MERFYIKLSGFLFLAISSVSAQIATDCTSAVPICNNTPVNGGTDDYGTDDFNGAFSTGCLERTATGAIESNSAWYRFRTGASGQLGFNIGFNTSEDWDFALYKANSCNSLGDPVRCNFFDNREGNAFMGVGEDPTGDKATLQYEDWLQVNPGEDYYLLINNFSANNSGFSIQFSGNIFVANPNDALDCSIISNLLGPPISACDNEIIILDATTNNAITYNWFLDTGSGFQLIPGQNNPTFQAMVAGFYRVEVVIPGSAILSDVQVGFSHAPTAFPIADIYTCPDQDLLDLSMVDIEALGGQDTAMYRVSYHSTLSHAVNGSNSLPKQHPKHIGNEILYVRITSISNPKCFDASRQFQLVTMEPSILDFPLEVYLCEGNLSTEIGQITSNPGYVYLWDSGETTSSITVSEAGTYTLTATFGEGGHACFTTTSVTVFISSEPQISEIIVEDLRGNNTVTVLTVTEGNYEYKMDDGVFQSSNAFTNVSPGQHEITLNDLAGCGSVTETIMVVGFPKFFTPNGDGINDLWQIQGISSLEAPRDIYL